MLLLVPLWVIFEIAQLVGCERYLRAAGGAGPSGPQGPREAVAFVWSALLVLYYVWMVLMLFREETRLLAAGLIVVSAAGFAIRRACAARRVLAWLSFEGALRVGMLVALLAGA